METNMISSYTLDQLAEHCAGPVSLLKEIYQSKHWDNVPLDYKILKMPNSVISGTYVNCLDMAVFARAFCNLKGIKNKISFITIVDVYSRKLFISHVVLIYKGQNPSEWFVWDLEIDSFGIISGPFKSAKEAASEFSGYYVATHNILNNEHEPKDIMTPTLTKEELEIVDNMIDNNTKCTQSSLIDKLNSVGKIKKKLQNTYHTDFKLLKSDYDLVNAMVGVSNFAHSLKYVFHPTITNYDVIEL